MHNGVIISRDNGYTLSAIYGLFVIYIYKIITRAAGAMLSANNGVFWSRNNWITPIICGNITRVTQLTSNPLNYFTKTRQNFYRILVFNHFYINDLNTKHYRNLNHQP